MQLGEANGPFGAITRRDMASLRPREPVRGPIINTYLHMLESAKATRTRTRLIPSGSTLYENLTKDNKGVAEYAAVSNHCKRVHDLFCVDRLLVPIHDAQRFHWMLGLIDIEHRRFEVYDSIFGEEQRSDYERHASNLRTWLQGEYTSTRRQHRKEYDSQFAESIKEWPASFPSCPQQQAGSNDCGVFVMIFAAEIAMNRKVSDLVIPNSDAFRKRIGHDIKQGTIGFTVALQMNEDSK